VTFLQPWGLLALFAVPAILVLHLFRQRRKPRRVAALFLFMDQARIVTTGRKPRPLEVTPSLLLELLAALLLALLVAGLSLEQTEPPHLLFVVDDSASMQAKSGEESTLARARDAILERIEEAGRRTEVTLVLTGDAPAVVLGPRAPRALVEAALRAWRPSAPAPPFGPALALARELAGARGQVVLVTDTPLPHPAEDLEVLAVGRALPNAAIVAAFREQTPKGERLLLDLQGFAGALETTLTLEARVGGPEGPVRPLGAPRRVALPPDRPAHVEVPLPRSLAGATLRVRLRPDALAPDNEAVLLPTADEPLRVALQVPAALSGSLQLGRALIAVGGVAPADAAHPAELVVALAGAALPSTARFATIWRLHPDAEGLARGPYLRARAHPLLQGVLLDEVAWPAAARPELRLPGLPLIEAAVGPLLSVETDEDRVAGASSADASATTTSPGAAGDDRGMPAATTTPAAATTATATPAASTVATATPAAATTATATPPASATPGTASATHQPASAHPASPPNHQKNHQKNHQSIHLRVEGRTGVGPGANATLARARDWPVLVANVVAVARAWRPGLDRSNVAVGAPIVYRPRSGESGLVLEGPAGQERPVPGGRGPVVWIAGRAGLYRLRDGAGNERALVSARFVAREESDLRAAATEHRRPTAVPDAEAGPDRGTRSLAPLLGLLLLLALAGDWAVLSRRRGPRALFWSPGPSRGGGA